MQISYLSTAPVAPSQLIVHNLSLSYETAKNPPHFYI